MHVNSQDSKSVDYRAAYAAHGTLAKAGAAMGMSRSNFHRLLKEQAGPVQAVQPVVQPQAVLVAAAQPSMASMLNAVLAAQSAQANLLARLVFEQAGGKVPEQAEKPRIRVRAGSAILLDGKQAEQPFGAAGPILRPMFGVRGARQANLVAPVSDTLKTVCFVGDLHGHPAIEDECSRSLALIGEHIIASKPDAVVVGGDWMDWSSACHHERNETWRGRFKPTLEDDMAACRNLLAVLAHYLDAAGIKDRVFLWGNHEEWVSHFENSHPEAHGSYTDRILQMFQDAGFVSFQYGEYAFLHGVGYTHAPKNKMDRPVGGATAENTVAMQSTHDVVFGHTHVFAVGKRVKFGFRNAVTVLNGGSCMPVGYVGDYAQKNMGSYIDSGVLDVHALDGRICGHAHLPMQLLERQHGAAATEYLSSQGRA